MKFVCPNCEETRIEEIMLDVVVSSILTEISEDGDKEYGNHYNEGGTVEHYQCVSCGYVLYDEKELPIDDPIDLIAWLKKNCPQGE